MARDVRRRAPPRHVARHARVKMMRRYLVFGRREYAEPLTEQGALQAASDEAARHAALEEYRGQWVELVLIPEEKIRWVLRSGETTNES